MASSVFVKDSTAVTRQVSEETVVVPVRAGAADLDSIYVLNETGTWIWERLDGRTGTDALIAGLMAEFDISEAQARGDLDEFLAGLAAEGLVKSVQAEGAR